MCVAKAASLSFLPLSILELSWLSFYMGQSVLEVNFLMDSFPRSYKTSTILRIPAIHYFVKYCDFEASDTRINESEGEDFYSRHMCGEG